MTIEEVKTRFVADIAKYKKDIQDAQKILNKFVQTSDTSMNKASTAEHKYQMALEKTKQKQLDLTKAQNTRSQSTQRLGADLAHTARNMMTLYYSAKTVAAIFKTGIDFNRFTQNAEASFRVMTKSALEARNIMASLRDFAVESPLGFEDTVDASRQLMAYGFQTKELVSSMKMLGTVSLATGHSLADVSYVYGTLRTQGRAYSRDLMQFAMRGIPIYQELSAVMGVNETAIRKLTEEGKVGFKEVEKAFQRMTSEGGRFFGMVDERMKTFDGAWSELTDTTRIYMGLLTEGVVKRAAKDIRDATEAVEAYSETWKDLGFVLEVVYLSISMIIKGAMSALGLIFRFSGIEALLRMARIEAEKLLGVAGDAMALAKKSFRDEEMSLNITQSQERRDAIPEVEPDTTDYFALLQKYQDEYRKMKAQQMVEDKKNIYALAQLELDLDRRKIQEEFKGQTDLMKQALAYADLIHEHKIVQIYKEEKARRDAEALADEQLRASMSARQRAELRAKYAKPTLAYLGSGGTGDDLAQVSNAISILTDALHDAKKNFADYMKTNGELVDGQYILMDEETRVSDQMREEMTWLSHEITLLTEAEKALLRQAETDAARDAARPIPGAFDGAPLDFRGTPLTEIAGSAMGTEVGQMAMGADPVTMAIMALVEFAMSIENVMKVLNPFKTLFEAMRPIIEPLVNGVLQPLVNVLEMVGEVVGQLLTPFLGMLQIVTSVAYIIQVFLMVPLQMLGAAFAWIYDSVLVPVGNKLIEWINGFIDGMNSMFGWLGVNIRRLQEMATTTEMANKKLKDESFMATFEEMVKRLNAEIDRQIESYKDLYQVGAISGAAYTKAIDGLNANRVTIDKQQLDQQVLLNTNIVDMTNWIKANIAKYEEKSGNTVTIGDPAADAAARAAAEAARIASEAAAKAIADAAAAAKAIADAAAAEAARIAAATATQTNIGQIQQWADDNRAALEAANDTTWYRMFSIIQRAAADIGSVSSEELASAFSYMKSLGAYASGTPSIPSDQLAMVHQGEGIVPRTFMDAIRAGELTLSGKDGSNNAIYNNYYVTVEGSVMKENDMTDSIARKLEQRMRRGYA